MTGVLQKLGYTVIEYRLFGPDGQPAFCISADRA